MDDKLPIGEELDFHYLLSLMPPLKSEPEFAWLPELFSIVGYETLIKLCKHAGGETIKIPTLDEVTDAIDGLQWFYDVHITHKYQMYDVPPKFIHTVLRIKEIYDVTDR